MRKILMIILFMAFIAGSFLFVVQNGEFTKWSHSSMGKNTFEKGEEFYFSYHFDWDGVVRPVLEKVEFIKSDGTILAKDDDFAKITSFISNREFGIVEESDIEGRELFPVKGYQ